jgi:hypothetical protein
MMKSVQSALRFNKWLGRPHMTIKDPAPNLNTPKIIPSPPGFTM